MIQADKNRKAAVPAERYQILTAGQPICSSICNELVLITKRRAGEP